MANAATMRRAERERAKLDRLASKCKVCQQPITPGQTWKFTPQGGKVHYHCAGNPTSAQEQMRETLLRSGIPMKEVKVFGQQIMVTTWSRDAAQKWADLLSKFATVRGVVRSVDYAKEQRGTVLRPTTVDVWRVGAYIPREANPAGPTYHEAMVMARQAGARIGDTSGFEPWLVKAKLQTRSPQVLRYLQEQFESGVEEGEAPKRKLETTHKGVTIFRSGDGFSTSLDPGSIHDTLKDAKRFIDAQRNPATPWWKRKNSATDVNLAFIAGQIGQRGVAWAYPGASYQEVFYNDSDEYLMEKAGVDPKDFATVRSKARMVFESGMQDKRSA